MHLKSFLLDGSVEKLSINGKKDNLQVSNILKKSWHNYQRVVKTEKTEYLSDLILKKEIPCGLWKLKKIATISASISPPTFDLSISLECALVFSQFEPMSFFSLQNIVAHLKASVCPTDIIPSCLLKEVWGTTGPKIQEIRKSRLTSDSVWSYFKQAVVQPLIKNLNFKASVLSNYHSILKPTFIFKLLGKVLHSFSNAHSWCVPVRS